MWIIVFALPNINLIESVGNENIAIVPHNDSRIVEITKQCSYAKALVENFCDQFGRKRHPSLLIISITAPQHIREIDAIVGFRNILAISTIIAGHEHSLTSRFVAYPLYSDYFDFYPTTITRNENGFLTQSPSKSGLDDEIMTFKGQTSPSLADLDHIHVKSNDYLFDQLQKAWSRRYLRNKCNEWSTQALFRSLEMAYQASSIPFKNHSTMYDYGASASLWVSAFEILSHPKTGSSNLMTVIDLIGKYDWLCKDLKRRTYAINYGKKRRNVNLIQKLYKELYDTRNAFLHGNPVKSNRLRPFRNDKIQHITRFAPLVYKVALLSYLIQFEGKRVKVKGEKEYIQRLMNENDLIDAFFKAKNPDS